MERAWREGKEQGREGQEKGMARSKRCRESGLGAPYFGVLIVRILLFRVLYLRPPIFGNSHMFQSVTQLLSPVTWSLISWKDTAGVVGTQVSDLRDGL